MEASSTATRIGRARTRGTTGATALITAVLLGLSVQLGSTPSNATQADSALAVFERVCARGADLWPTDLCGPMILVDATTRGAVANAPLEALGFQPIDGRWRGTLPDSILIANTASEIAGTRWSMLLDDLPTDRFDLIDLLVHESFHRIQPELGLNIATPLPPHLEQETGRLWLRMELRALAAALRGPGNTAPAASDAVVFRRARYALHPGADTVEAALEIQEGLAAYTGARVARDALAAPDSRVADKVASWEARESYGRTFAYGTGPALGLLLDRLAPTWRDEVGPDNPPHALLARALAPAGFIRDARAQNVDDLVASARERAAAYGFADVAGEERERAIRTRARLDSLRAHFTSPPLVVLQDGGVQASFDPRQLTPLEGLGTVYGTGQFRSDWGALTVQSGGALLSEDWTTLTLSGTPQGSGLRWAGPGWSLQLAEGWTLAQSGAGRWRAVQQAGSVQQADPVDPVQQAGSVDPVQAGSVRQARPLRLTGTIELRPSLGYLHGALCVDGIARADTLTFTLNRGLEVGVVRAGRDGPVLSHSGYYDGEWLGEGLLYDVAVPDSLAQLATLCVEYAGAVPVFDGNPAVEDWKGRIVANRGTIRAMRRRSRMVASRDRVGEGWTPKARPARLP